MTAITKSEQYHYERGRKEGFQSAIEKMIEIVARETMDLCENSQKFKEEILQKLSTLQQEE